MSQGWYHVDAADRILGRLATKVAIVLMGKHRPIYTAHVDTGEFVIITNAEKIRLTGRKRETMTYERYSYYPGGRTVVPFEAMMQRHPERVVRDAVRRMLPKNALGRRMLTKLKVYAGAEHPHTAQQPESLNVE